MSMYVLFWGLCAVLGINAVAALIAIASASGSSPRKMRSKLRMWL